MKQERWIGPVAAVGTALVGAAVIFSVTRGQEQSQQIETPTPSAAAASPTPTETPSPTIRVETPAPESTPTKTPELTASLKTYISSSKRITFQYPSDWNILPAPDSYDGGKVIELQGPKQRLRIYDNGTPNYGFDDFTVVDTTATIAGQSYPARKYTSQSFGNSFIDVKVQDTPYKLYIQYGDAASVGFQGFNQKYDEKVIFDSDIAPIQTILSTFKFTD